MKKKNIYSLLALTILIVNALYSQETISLEGIWNVKTDPGNIGRLEKWFDQILTGEITLPGSLDEHRIGNPVH